MQSSEAVAEDGVAPVRPRTRPRKRVIAGVAGAVLVVVGIAYYLHSRHFESTDDAQIDGNISNVSPRVAGTVTAVHVLENQHVTLNQPLATVDDADLKVAVAQAQATVAQAEAALAAEDPSVPITQSSNVSAMAGASSELAAAEAGVAVAERQVDQLTAELAEAEANKRTADQEKQRGDQLVAANAIARADYDRRVNTAVAAKAQIEALHRSFDAAKARVTQQQASLVAIRGRLAEVRQNAPRQVETRKASVLARQAALDLARAQLSQAQLNLGYASVRAPIAGIVAKKAVNVGDRVSPGQAIVAITSSDDIWVTANFRETQLQRIHPGQTVSVHVDALGTDYEGTVDSVGGATGSRLSVLPPENASGNYVKVVQRIPVRIRFKPGLAGLDRVRIGMSVEPTIRVVP